MMPFIESNILMNLFRIARLLLLFFFVWSRFVRRSEKGKASFCGSTKAVEEEAVDNDGGDSVGLI
jgi:hypothetical protein